MALPKIEHPLFTTTIPSSGKVVRFRPFLTKEEKILLMAISGTETDYDSITLAAKQIVTNCVVDLDEDIDKMPIFDIEWLFIQIRIKSVDKFCNIAFTPVENGGCDKCKKGMSFKINLEDVKCEVDPSHNKKIQLTDKIGMVMGYPTPEILDTKSDDFAKNLYEYIKGCIEFIYDEEKTYSWSDFTSEELDEFLDELNSDQMEKIETYFNTIPECKYELEVKCDCGDLDSVVVLSGLSDFFA